MASRFISQAPVLGRRSAAMADARGRSPDARAVATASSRAATKPAGGAAYRASARSSRSGTPPSCYVTGPRARLAGADRHVRLADGLGDVEFAGPAVGQVAYGAGADVVHRAVGVGQRARARDEVHRLAGAVAAAG